MVFLVAGASASAAILAAASSVRALPVSPVLLQDDVIPGIGAVSALRSVAIDDDGHWIVYAETNFYLPFQDDVLFRDGVVFVREDDPLPAPPGARADSIFGMAANASGGLVLSFFLDGPLGPNDLGVYWGTTLLIQRSYVCHAPELAPGTRYLGFDAAKPAPNALRMLVVATVNTAIPSMARALVSVLHDGAGALLSEHVIVAEGDTLPGTDEPLQDIGRGWHESAIDDDGRALYFADLSGDVRFDGCVCLDDVVLAREGSASPVPGRSYEFLLGRGKDLGVGGDWISKANLGGNTVDDEILLKDGAVLAREGRTLPDIAPFTLSSFGVSSGPVWLDELGRAIWFGEWDDPDTTRDGGLFRDDLLLVREGDAQADGMPIVAIASGPGAFAASPDGSHVIFLGQLADGRKGAFVLDLAAAVDVPSPLSEEYSVSAGLHLAVAPNPFRESLRVDAVGTDTAPGRVSVHDLGGRLIRELRSKPFRWDGCDDFGRPMPSGVYVVRLEEGAQVVARKVVLLR